MQILQSNGYMFEDGLILFKEFLRLIERCLVCCRDFLCNAFLPSRRIVPSTVLNGSVLMFWIKRCIFTCWKNHYLINMKSDTFKKSDFLQRNATYWKGMFFFLRKVFVCKACSCQLELFLQKKDACLIVFCRHLQCFPLPFSGLEKRPNVETFFMWNHSPLGKLCREVEVLGT